LPTKSVAGNLETMPLPDILLWCKNGRKTGILTISRREIVKNFYFEEGRLVSASSNDPKEYLGQLLLSSGKISEEQLLRAFQTQKETKALLGNILVKSEQITWGDLEDFLHHKIIETVFDVFLWEEGSFSFREAPLSDENLNFRVEMDAEHCVLEGARRFDDWTRFREAFPDDSLVLFLKCQDPPDYADKPEYQRLFALIGKGLSIEEICLELRSSPYSVLSTLYELHEKDLLGISGRKTAGKEKSPPAPRESTVHRESEKEATRYIYDMLLPPTQVPYVSKDLKALSGCALNSEEAFVLSRINGEWNVQSIVMISPIQELKTLRILLRFLHDNIIALR
jgi:hypothetical protein